jgi:hypothetical protein
MLCSGLLDYDTPYSEGVGASEDLVLYGMGEGGRMIVIAVVPSKTQWFVTNGKLVCAPVYCVDGFRSFSWRLRLTF